MRNTRTKISGATIDFCFLYWIANAETPTNSQLNYFLEPHLHRWILLPLPLFHCTSAEWTVNTSQLWLRPQSHRGMSPSPSSNTARLDGKTSANLAARTCCDNQWHNGSMAATDRKLSAMEAALALSRYCYISELLVLAGSWQVGTCEDDRGRSMRRVLASLRYLFRSLK